MKVSMQASESRHKANRQTYLLVDVSEALGLEDREANDENISARVAYT